MPTKFYTHTTSTPSSYSYQNKVSGACHSSANARYVMNLVHPNTNLTMAPLSTSIQNPDIFTPVVPLETNPRFSSDWLKANSGSNVIFCCNHLSGSSTKSKEAFKINSTVYADWAKETKTFSQLAKLSSKSKKIDEFIRLHKDDSEFIQDFDKLGKMDIMIFTNNEARLEASSDKSSVICGIRGTATASLIACKTREDADYLRYYIQKSGYGSCLAVCTFSDIKNISKIDNLEQRQFALNILASNVQSSSSANITIEDMD
ncbi:MAG: hypothetical protein RLZZ210_1561 [Pseudomonadota bacterium]|jgi:hypothetical protein